MYGKGLLFIFGNVTIRFTDIKGGERFHAEHDGVR